MVLMSSLESDEELEVEELGVLDSSPFESLSFTWPDGLHIKNLSL